MRLVMTRKQIVIVIVIVLCFIVIVTSYIVVKGKRDEIGETRKQIEKHLVISLAQVCYQEKWMDK